MFLQTLSILSIGFSVVAGAILFIAYVKSPAFPKKTMVSLTSGALLIACLSTLQLFHLGYFLSAKNPLDSSLYLICLFAAPVFFLYFFRAVVLPDAPFQPALAALLLIVLLPSLLPLDIALPILFTFGTLFSLWLSRAVFLLRDRRKQNRFELFFGIVTSSLAIGVLILGSMIPTVGADYYYVFYALAIGFAYGLVLYALTAIPDFADELFEVARSKYSVSTLGDVDVPACLQRLDALMQEERLYTDEDLSLASLSEAVGISGHQLSELINTRLNCSVTQYVKQQRIAAAKQLLKQAPKQSVLSISLETGFKSQSTFYAAFKEDTGQSPGEFRKS